MTSRRQVLTATGIAAALIGLAACSGSLGTGDKAALPAGRAGGVAASRPGLAPAVPDAAGSAATSGEAAGGSAAQHSPATAAALVLPGESLIRTAQLDVDIARARDVSAAADRANVIADSAGGEVDSDDRTSGRNAQADLVLRVPPEALSSVLTRLADLGTERGRQLSSTDVTEKVADVNSRVASAQATISRLRTIYDRATKISDVLAIEDELSSREADLEALQAQQRALDRTTSMATISLSLRTASKAAVPAKHHDRGGFLGGLERGWHAFTSAATASAGGLGAALPFLVLVLVVGLIGRLGRRRLTRRGTPAPSAAGPPATQ